MTNLLVLFSLFLCSVANADFNTGDTFGKGMVIQANGVTQTGGGRTLNFASGVTVTVNNSAYQITAGSSGSGTINNGTPNLVSEYVGVNTLGPTSSLYAVGNNVGVGSASPGTALDVTGVIRASSNIAIGTYSVCQSNGTNCPASSSISGLTTNFVTKATSATTIGNSTIFDNGNVGIGTTTPTSGLVVLNGNTGLGTLTAPSRLYVAGQAEMTGLKLDGNGASSGYALVSNSLGVGTWVPATSLAITTTPPGGSINNVQYNNPAGTFAGSNNFNFNGTNIGLGTVSVGSRLTILGNVGVGTVAGDNFLTNAAPIGGALFSGNVGIGTWKPMDVLHIKGASGGLTVDSSGIMTSNTFTYSALSGFGTGFSNLNLRSVISAANIPNNNWVQIQVQLTAPSNNSTTINSAYVGVSAGSYNFATSPAKVQLTFSGSNSVTISSSSTVLSDWATISYDGTSDLLISIGLGTSNFIAALLSGGDGGFYGGSSANAVDTSAPGGGTSDPVREFVISSATFQTAVFGSPAIKLAASGSQNGLIWIDGNDANKLKFDAPTTTRMTMDINGNVGIGTTSPKGLLTIMGGNVGIGTNTPNSSLIVQTGNVGIGTAFTASKLTIATSQLMQKITTTNTACNTVCGQMACYFGEDTGILGTLTDCADATADVCFCSK